MKKYYIILHPLVGKPEEREVYEGSKLQDQIDDLGFPKVIIDSRRAFTLTTQSTDKKDGTAKYSEVTMHIFKL